MAFPLLLSCRRADLSHLCPSLIYVVRPLAIAWSTSF